MPELPEVETMRRGILGVEGATIQAVERLPCRRKPILIRPRIDSFRQQVVGAEIRHVSRAGKRIALELSNDRLIVLEPRMTGLILVADPPTRQHLRWQLQTTSPAVPRLMYWDRRGLGRVTLLSRDAFRQQYGGDRIGPDALTIDAALLRERLGRSRRAIKVALLDQRAIAGIGNLYASEILHVARLHPLLPCRGLTGAEWRRLAEAVRDVLCEAIRYEGSTLSDGTYRNALSKNGSYQNHHRVYDKADTTCSRCRRSAIVRIVQTQRSTFFCPRCQRKSGRTPRAE